MRLEQFIQNKPDTLRLGQWFYNCYFYKLGWNTELHHETQELYNTRCMNKAIELIKQIMADYQWAELPEIERSTK
jgi:hypothetical protein